MRANELSRPHGYLRPTPAEKLSAGIPVTDIERIMFNDTVEEAVRCIKRERGAAENDDSRGIKMTDYTDRHGYNKRYQKRREQGCAGWSDAESYEKKRSTIEKVLVSHRFPKKARFLELGCGNGNITLFMAEKGFESYGIDIIPEAIIWAEERKNSTSVDADFQVGSVVDLKPYSDDCFDFIFDGDCLHCIIGPDRKKCLASIYRVLKPEGIFHVRANCMKKGLNTRFEIAGNCYFDPQSQCVMRDGVPYYYLSREEEFAEELQEAGFEILESEYINDFKDKQPYQSFWLYVNATKSKKNIG